jgi:deoxycytidylate deaminase
MNSIISASRKEMLGADLYLAGWGVVNEPDCTKQEIIDPRPCEICLRLIKNAGINRVINRSGVIYERAADGILYRVS